jgi:hypothetical protein
MNKDEIETITLPFGNVSVAPTVAGLYAWYARPSIARADFKGTQGNGGDVGHQRIRSALVRHTARFDPPPKRLSSRSPFGGRWRGEMVDHGRAKIRRTILQDPPHHANSIEEKVYLATRDQKCRERLVEVLEMAHPLLASPVYIGVTNNLRRRLKEHTDSFLELKERCVKLDNYLNRLKAEVDNSSTDFAHRAVAAEFTAEHLFVVAIPLASPIAEADADHLNILSAAEWLLNRWYLPPFGRK